MTVQQHYEQYSMIEGTSPNAYFNTIEYLEAKAAQLNSHAEGGKTNWDAASVAKAFQDAGLTPEQHYLQYGCKETDVNGYLINPSNAFDANAYVQAKLAQLVASGDPQYAEWTAADVVNAIADAGMTPVDHYEDYGKQEGAASGISMVQTVPVTQRVTNDELRAATGENVPSNYNKPVDAPAEVTATTATAVNKPCDMATSTKPAEPVAVPGDSDYVAVPGGGITDTNANPVVLVTASVTDDTGRVIDTETQYGVASTSTENGVTTKTVQPVNSDGTVNATAAPIQTVETNSSTGTTTTTTNLTDSEGNTLSVTETTTPTTNGGTQTTTSATLTDENNKQIAKTETTTTANAAGEQTGSTSTYTDANNQTHTTESGDVPSPTPTPTPDNGGTGGGGESAKTSFTLSALTDAAVGEDGTAALNGTAAADTITLDSLPSGEKWAAATELAVDAKAGNDTIAVANSLVASEDAYWQALAAHYNAIAQVGLTDWTADMAKHASTDAGLNPPQGGLTAVNVDGGAGTDTLNITGDLDLSKWTFANVENVNFGTHFVSMSTAEFNKIATSGHTLIGAQTGEITLTGADTSVTIDTPTLVGSASDSGEMTRWSALDVGSTVTTASVNVASNVRFEAISGTSLAVVNLSDPARMEAGTGKPELSVQSLTGSTSGMTVNVKDNSDIILGALTNVTTVAGDTNANLVEFKGEINGSSPLAVNLAGGDDTVVIANKLKTSVSVVNVDGGDGTDRVEFDEVENQDVSKWTFTNVENFEFGNSTLTMSAAEFNKIATTGHTLTGHETGELTLVGDDTTTNVTINKAILKGEAADGSNSNRWDSISMDNKITSVSLTADNDVSIMGLKGDALTTVNLEMTKVRVPGQGYPELTVKSIDGASSGASVNVKGVGTITLGALTDVTTINGDETANRVEINDAAGNNAVTVDLGGGADTFVVGKKMTGTVTYKMAAESASADTITLLPPEYDDDSDSFDAATACTGKVLPHVKLDVSAFLGSTISSTLSTHGFTANALTVVTSNDKVGTAIDTIVANLFATGEALNGTSLANGKKAILAVTCAAGDGGVDGEDNPASVYIFGVTGADNFAANAASHVQLLGTVEWTTTIGVDNFVTA